jgi:hypothetical protein
MWSKDTKQYLAGSLGFRLALNRSAEAKPPLPNWVIERVLGDRAFSQRLEEIIGDLAAKGGSGAVELPVEKYDSRNRESLFDAIAADRHIQLLVSEHIERYNARVNLFAGWKSHIDSLLKYLIKDDHKDGSEAQLRARQFPIRSLGFNGSPLLPLGLAGALGVGAAGAATYVFKEVHDVRISVQKTSQTISEQSTKVTAEVKRDFDNEVTRIERAVEIATECSKPKPSCRADSGIDSLQTELDQIESRNQQISTAFLSQLRSDAKQFAELATESKAFEKSILPLPAAMTIKLEGIPAISFPRTFKIEPNYRVDALPSSSVTIKPPFSAKLKVESTRLRTRRLHPARSVLRLGASLILPRLSLHERPQIALSRG